MCSVAQTTVNIEVSGDHYLGAMSEPLSPTARCAFTVLILDRHKQQPISAEHQECQVINCAHRGPLWQPRQRLQEALPKRHLMTRR